MTANNEYGKALFLLTEEEGSTERTVADIKTVLSCLNENPDYTKLLDTPAIAKDEKITLIDNAFSSLEPMLVNLIKILSEKHAVYSFASVSDTYVSLYNEARGIEEVEAVTARPLTEAQAEKLKEKLAGLTGKTIILKNTVSAEILGGIKLRYMGRQIDGSVRTRLDKFEDSLKNIVI